MAQPGENQPAEDSADQGAPRTSDREWTKVQNWVFDAVMPRLSGNGFKVFCVVVRQTWGWKLPGATDDRTRKQWDIISWSQFQEKAGIDGKDTVKRALDECLGGGFIKRSPAGQSFAYTLPTSLETIPVLQQDRHPYGNGTDSAMETIHTKAKENKGNQSGAAPAAAATLPPEFDAVYAFLIGWGVRKKTARQLALECSYEYATGWGEETRRLMERGRVNQNPAGFLVQMLSEGEPLPPMCFTCGKAPHPGRFCLDCGKPLCRACSWLFKREHGQGRFWCVLCLNAAEERREAQS